MTPARVRSGMMITSRTVVHLTGRDAEGREHTVELLIDGDLSYARVCAVAHSRPRHEELTSADALDPVLREHARRLRLAEDKLRALCAPSDPIREAFLAGVALAGGSRERAYVDAESYAVAIPASARPPSPEVLRGLRRFAVDGWLASRPHELADARAARGWLASVKEGA